MATSTIIGRSREANIPGIQADQLIRDEAKRSRDMVETGYMILAKCLYDIYQQNLYSKWDYITFENYVDVELQISYRKAMYLVEIYNKAKMLDMDMVRLEKLGWTKARELIKVVDENNADEWLARAENTTSKELNVLVRQEKDTSNARESVIDETPTITTITFKLGMVESAIITEALEESKRLINNEDLALAFANVCQEWLEIKGIIPTQMALEDHIELLERVYGKKLVISGIAGSVAEDVDEEEEDEEEVSPVSSNTEDIEEIFR